MLDVPMVHAPEPTSVDIKIMPASGESSNKTINVVLEEVPQPTTVAPSTTEETTTEETTTTTTTTTSTMTKSKHVDGNKRIVSFNSKMFMVTPSTTTTTTPSVDLADRPVSLRFPVVRRTRRDGSADLPAVNDTSVFATTNDEQITSVCSSMPFSYFYPCPSNSSVYVECYP